MDIGSNKEEVKLVSAVMLPAAAPAALVTHAEEDAQPEGEKMTRYQMTGAECTINFDKDWKFQLDNPAGGTAQSLTGAAILVRRRL